MNTPHPGMRFYAGIGSRSTPPNVQAMMTSCAMQLSETSWVLRSGHAEGADKAFEGGATYREIFLPWHGFNNAQPGARGHVVPDITPEMEAIAKAYHPNWAACSQGARKMHIRNVCQVLGADCKTPVEMVICWTPNGSGSGGTGQAIRIAKGYDIPVFDIALVEHQLALVEFVNKREAA